MTLFCESENVSTLALCGAFGSIAKLEHGAPRLLPGFTPTAACFDQLFGKLEWHHKTIKAESSLDRKLLAEIKETFQESKLTFRADVLDWNDITSAFRRTIDVNSYE